MSRILALSIFMALPAFAQVPPGLPYDAGKHPNAIVTYVTNAEFNAVSFVEARDVADIELLGLSQVDGKREEIQMAETAMKKVKIGGREADVTFYPVIRQTFTLKGGATFLLYSFKFPKLPFPSQVAAQILNEAAFAKSKKPEEGRFGLATPPEHLEIRGSEALLFEKDGEPMIFWTEDGVAHTASAKTAQKELFRLVEDLL